jgi:hypothetical protein
MRKVSEQSPNAARPACRFSVGEPLEAELPLDLVLLGFQALSKRGSEPHRSKDGKSNRHAEADHHTEPKSLTGLWGHLGTFLSPLAFAND